jgi:hypothetical protein
MDAAHLDDAEVVFAVRIIVPVEGFEVLNFSKEGPTLVGGHRSDACGDNNGPADEGAAEGIVEIANAGGGF